MDPLPHKEVWNGYCDSNILLRKPKWFCYLLHKLRQYIKFPIWSFEHCNTFISTNNILNPILVYRRLFATLPEESLLLRGHTSENGPVFVIVGVDLFMKTRIQEEAELNTPTLTSLVETPSIQITLTLSIPIL